MCMCVCLCVHVLVFCLFLSLTQSVRGVKNTDCLSAKE